MGPSKAEKTAESSNIQLQQEQMGLLKEQTAQSAADRARMEKLQAPEITFLQDLISGNKTAEMSAAAPTIAELSSGFTAAKENIMNTVGPGAGRDVALANLELNKDVGISSTLANLASGAREKLANIGAGLGAFSLQELGAGLRAGEGAGQTGQGIMGAENARKASTMSFLGQLVGAGADIATGGIAGVTTHP